MLLAVLLQSQMMSSSGHSSEEIVSIYCRLCKMVIFQPLILQLDCKRDIIPKESPRAIFYKNQIRGTLAKRFNVGSVINAEVELKANDTLMEVLLGGYARGAMKNVSVECISWQG